MPFCSDCATTFTFTFTAVPIVPMITPAYCQLLARYAQWMNARLHASVASMDDAARRLDRGAFFGSILETCNHLVWGDRVWLARFTDTAAPAGDFGRGMFDDFTALAAERATTDLHMQAWAATVTTVWLGSTLRYRSVVDGQDRAMPAAIAAIHLFNHGTHHRGQLTTLLSQAGVDPGVTDLPWLPGIVTVAGKAAS
ncbi:MAG: DinB family protein [Casimicrobiaceae bacterium]